MTLYISGGQETVPVPSDLVGETLQQAQKELQTSQLYNSVHYQPITNPSQDGYVISTNPKPGASVKQNSTVTLYIGEYTGPTTTTTVATTTTATTAPVATTRGPPRPPPGRRLLRRGHDDDGAGDDHHQPRNYDQRSCCRHHDYSRGDGGHVPFGHPRYVRGPAATGRRPARRAEVRPVPMAKPHSPWAPTTPTVPACGRPHTCWQRGHFRGVDRRMLAGKSRGPRTLKSVDWRGPATAHRRPARRRHSPRLRAGRAKS